MSRYGVRSTSVRVVWILALFAGAAGQADDKAADTVAVVPAVPTAGNAASRGWQCRLCPAPEGWTGEADVGAGWVSESSLKFGDYRGLEEEGGFAAVDGAIRYQGEATTVE